MEWAFVCLALIPAVFCPRVLFNAFALPQGLAVSLLSTASVVVGVWRGMICLSTPIHLLFLFLIYFVLASFRTDPIHNAKKEFGLQVPFFLLFLILPGYVNPLSVKGFILTVTIVSGLICLYANGQTKMFDPFFPNDIKQGGPKDNAIGTIGNPNFLSAYLSGCFWLTVYAGVNYDHTYWIVSLFILWIIYRTGSRAGQLAIVGSVVFLVLAVAYKGWVPNSDFIFNLGLASVILVAIFVFFLFKINWQTFWYKPMDPNGQRIWYSSFRYRLCYWLVAVHLLKERWLWGWGPWSYRKEVYRGQAELADKYPGFLDRDRYVTPQPRECHNDWLEHLFEFGVVGAGIFFSFVGVVFWYGIQIVDGSFSNLLLLTNLVAIIIDATFFFALRIPGSAIQFWGTCIIITGLSGKGVYHSFAIPNWMLVIIILMLILVVWEFVSKRVMASYYFMRSMYHNGTDRYVLLMRALEFMPYDSLMRTHATIITSDYAPVVSQLHASKMLEHFDGQTPRWAALYNYALTWLKGYHYFFDIMTFYLKASHYVLPYFKPTKQLLEGKGSISLKSQYIGGATMRILDEVTLWKIRTFISNRDSLNKDVHILNQEIEKIKIQIQNVQTQMQLAMANVENLVLFEKKKMNIPDNWFFDANDGIFKDPATIGEEECKKLGLEG